MSEQLARRSGNPGERLECLYRAWSKGGAGLLISGNVMVDRHHVESTRNVILAGADDLAPFKAWSTAGRVSGNAFWMQLNHPGRQTPRHVNPRPLGPSSGEAVKLFGRRGAFGPPKGMSSADIEGVIEQFAEAAGQSIDAGFDGVQIHAAHGYLLSQFLSPLVNRRRDDWGGSLDNRARLLLSVVAAVRARIGASKAIGVKLNSADFQRGGFDEDDSLGVLDKLGDAGVDLVEISGGSYESHAMFDRAQRSSKRVAREAYFLDFARRARKSCTVPLMVTGGFRRRVTMETALEDDVCDVVGMARPFALEADVATQLLAGAGEAAYQPRAIGRVGPLALLSDAGYCVYAIAQLAQERPVDPTAPLYRVALKTAVGFVRHTLRG